MKIRLNLAARQHKKYITHFGKSLVTTLGPPIDKHRTERSALLEERTINYIMISVGIQHLKLLVGNTRYLLIVLPLQLVERIPPPPSSPPLSY